MTKRVCSRPKHCWQGWHCGRRGEGTAVTGGAVRAAQAPCGRCHRQHLGTIRAVKAARRCPQVPEPAANLRMCTQRETAAACSVCNSRVWAQMVLRELRAATATQGNLSLPMYPAVVTRHSGGSNRAGWPQTHWAAVLAISQCHQGMKSSDAHNPRPRRLIGLFKHRIYTRRRKLPL